MKRIALICLLAACAAVATISVGSGGTGGSSSAQAQPPESAREGGSDRNYEFGDSVRGRDLRAHRIGPADAKRVVLVVGSIHGDEREGHEIISRLKRESPNRAAIWLVETVNPDGVASGQRKNARGVDLNRNFRTGWRPSSDTSSGYYPGPRPFSEPESRAVRKLVRRIKPNVTVWYHQPWNQVLGSCEGRDAIQREYAKRVGMEFACRGGDLPGTATKWQTRDDKRKAFVVELAPGELSSSAGRRHADAVLALARPDDRARAGSMSRQVSKPDIRRDPIPFGNKRKRQMAKYSERHYGERTWRLDKVRQIALHYTTTSTYRPVWNTFANNAPNLGEKPGTCAQYVVDKDGTIYQLVDRNVRCRHTVGLNHRSLGIEIVQESSGSPERDILNRRRQRVAAQRLVAWLCQRYDLKIDEVIGHAMANDSRYFKDLSGWRNDHSDWGPKPVREFRKGVRKIRDG